jgi:hypothetical protein
MVDKNSGPCPPIEKPKDEEKADNRLAEKTEADYSAEETMEDVA